MIYSRSLTNPFFFWARLISSDRAHFFPFVSDIILAPSPDKGTRIHPYDPSYLNRAPGDFFTDNFSVDEVLHAMVPVCAPHLLCRILRQNASLAGWGHQGSLGRRARRLLRPPPPCLAAPRPSNSLVAPPIAEADPPNAAQQASYMADDRRFFSG
jgi:hypothetical protein